MSKKIFLLLLLSIALLTGLNAKTVKEFKLEPLTRYRLSFNASGKNSTWELQIFNKDGLLPYEGSFKNNWQKIVSARKKYTHSFFSPRDGALLKFIVDSQRNMPELSDIKLEKISNTNPVVNGDLSAGMDNYSGWNTHKRAKLIKDSNGRILLKCQPDGYAVTDPIPVEPGATYRYTPGSRIGQVLTYTRDLLRIGLLPRYHRKSNPFIKIPADTAFIRLEYCDGRDWQKGRVPVINKVGIELVKKGKETPVKDYPNYPGEIVLKTNSSLSEVRGAREIQHWVKKISGKEMRVLAAPSDKDNTKIYIGKKWAEKLFPKDLKFLKGSDGFAVRKKGENIYIFGARPAGSLFGSIRFLEKNTDIIFARPRKEFGTVYSKNPRLVFRKTNFFMRPAFVHRITGRPYASRSDDGIWQGRVGFNTPSYYYNQFRREEEGGVASFLSNYMSTIIQSPQYSYAVCKEKYPELFAEINGKRKASPHSYICPTHPVAAKAVAAGLCAVIKKAKAKGIDLEFVGVRVKDGWGVCSCKRCMRPIKLPNGKLLKPKSDTARRDPLFFSTRKAVLLNKVAEEFAKTYPERSISVECYIYTAEPPAIPYKPSLMTTFCSYDTCSIRFPILDGKNCHYRDGEMWARRFKEYLKRNKLYKRKISMFAYYYPCGFSTVADSAAADWEAMLKSGGVHGIHLDSFTPDMENYKRRVQYLHMWDYQAIERWIIARLMWNPTLDPQKLREDYIKRAYGKAAPEMLKFYNVIRKNWEDPKIKYGVNCHTQMANLFETFIVKTGNEKKLRSLLVKAEEKTINSNSKILIQRTLRAFDRFAKCLNRTYIPFVPESTAEWNSADSTFWMAALKMGDFKRISTWNDFKQAPAVHQTQVSIMRDEKNLYFRFQALKAGKKDRVELVLGASRHSVKYFFAIERTGKTYSMLNYSSRHYPGWETKLENNKNSYVAMFKIPLNAIKGLKTSDKEFKLLAKFARLVYDGKNREESSLIGVSITMSHYLNYWTSLSIKKRKD